MVPVLWVDFPGLRVYLVRMKTSVEDLRRLSLGILRRCGLSEEDARVVAEAVMEAELRGRPAHGVVRLPGIADRLASKGRVPMRVSRQAGACTLVDGKGNLGYLVAHRCARTVAEKARHGGIGLVGAFHTDSCGLAGYYVSLVVNTGLICLMMCNTSPRVVPWGATEPVLGANPIAAGFPFSGGQVLIDLSTAAVTSGDILMAMKSGRRIPDGSALDAEGRLTTDPQAAFRGASLPFGGHKGYALSLIVQVLSSVLMGAAPVPKPGENYGLLMLAVSPTIFVDREAFDRGVGEIVRRVKSARRADPAAEVLIPGERAFRERERRLREGVEVDAEVMEELEKLMG